MAWFGCSRAAGLDRRRCALHWTCNSRAYQRMHAPVCFITHRSCTARGCAAAPTTQTWSRRSGSGCTPSGARGGCKSLPQRLRLAWVGAVSAWANLSPLCHHPAAQSQCGWVGCSGTAEIAATFALLDAHLMVFEHTLARFVLPPPQASTTRTFALWSITLSGVGAGGCMPPQHGTGTTRLAVS